MNKQTIISCLRGFAIPMLALVAVAGQAQVIKMNEPSLNDYIPMLNAMGYQAYSFDVSAIKGRNVTFNVREFVKGKEVDGSPRLLFPYIFEAKGDKLVYGFLPSENDSTALCYFNWENTLRSASSLKLRQIYWESEDKYVYSYGHMIADNISGIAPTKFLETETKDDEYFDIRYTLMTAGIYEDEFKDFYLVVPTEDDLIYISEIYHNLPDGSEDLSDVQAEFLEHRPYRPDEKEAMMQALSCTKMPEEEKLFVGLRELGGERLATALVPVRSMENEVPALVGIDVSIAAIWEAQMNLYIMLALTNKKERLIRMPAPRQVSQKEKIIFPVVGFLTTAFIVPSGLPLLGMLFFGNLLKECGVTKRLSDVASNAVVNICTLLIGITVGASTQASVFLSGKSVMIFGLGAGSFIVATFCGVLFVKIMNLFLKEGNKINPLIGNSGVSAVPDAARVSNNVGLEYDKTNYLLQHAMGPNVAGVVGSAVAAGILLAFLH